MFHLALYGCGNRTRALVNSLILDKFYDVGALFDLDTAAMEKTQAQFGGKIKRSHLKHLQRLSHLRRQRLRLGETLRQVISWTGHVEDIIS